MRWLGGVFVLVACGRTATLPRATAGQSDDTDVDADAGVGADASVQSTRPCPSTNWTVETIAASGDFAVPSIALDPTGDVHVGWSFLLGPVLHAHRSPVGTWSTDTVAELPGGTGGLLFVSLAVDAGGAVLALYPQIGDSLRLSTLSADVWTTEIVQQDMSANFGCSLAVDAWNNRHASFYSGLGFANFGLKYAFRDDDGWHASIVDGELGVASEAPITTDADGGVHIAYHAAKSGELRYAYKPREGEWTTETVAAVGSSTTIALAIDDAGVKHLVYSHCPATCVDKVILSYAHQAFNDGWLFEDIVDDGANWGSRSISVESAGVVHAAYCKYTFATETSRPHYARRSDDGSWRTTQVADVGCAFTSLVHHDSGTVHVTFNDDASGEVKYARCTP